MNNDETRQAKAQWTAKLNQKTQNIQIQINDGITYLGELPVMPGMNVQKIIEKIQKAEVDVVAKTTSKMEIQLGFVTITLHSSQNLELMKLKTQIVDLKTELKQLKKWENLNLESVDQFSVDSIYKIKLSTGQGCFITIVTVSKVYYYYIDGGYYTIEKSSKAKSNGGHIVTQIKRMVV